MSWSIGKKFDKPFTAALIGSTKSGKTTFLTYLIPKIAEKFDFVLFFSNNRHSEIYKKLLKIENLISFDGFVSQIIRDLIKYNKKFNNELNILVLIDDEVNSKSDKIIKNLFSVLRNSNFSTIYSGQDWSFITKANRNNINYLFLFKQNTVQAYVDINKIYFKGLIPTDKIKKYEIEREEVDFLRNNTLDYNILVLDILNDYKMSSFKVNL